LGQHHLLMTFAIAASLGVFLLVLANRIKISAIVILLVGGILAGPEMLGLVHPDELGMGLRAIVSLAVGLILFEGGLTLDVGGYRRVSREIWGVLTIGVLTTWILTAVTIHFVFDFAWSFCFLAGSLIIVTGPTVIGPLLRRIGVREDLHHILHWEGVLIDPVGVFIALLCFELYLSTGDQQGLLLLDFLLRFAVGVVFGVVFGLAIFLVLKRNWVPKEYLNIFVLACAILCFSIADSIVTESGLLSVTLAGLLIGYWKPPNLAQVVTYKVELKDFLIGLLFVLLAANLDLDEFAQYGTGLVLVVAVIMFVIRPLNIFLSTRGSALNLRDKLFLGWIAPRGIVAASMASVFALTLSEQGTPNADFLETFTYSVIAGTVVFQGFSARLVGKLLGVLRPEPTGWVIVGAHRLGRELGKFIRDQGLQVVLVDTNKRAAWEANKEGLTTVHADAMAVDPESHEAFYGCGNFLALTPNENLNQILCQRWRGQLDGLRCYRWEKEGLEQEVADTLQVGTGVFQSIELDDWMGAERKVPKLVRVTVVPAEIADPSRVLLSFFHGQVMPGVDASVSDSAEVLSIEKPRRKPSAAQLPVKPEYVVFTEEADLETLYERMIELVQDKVPDLDTREILDSLMEREEEFTSLLGYGISLPHTYSDRLAEPVLLVARAEKRITCQHTGMPIDLVFMLLSPMGQPKQHLDTISQLARMIGRESGRQDLLEAETPEALYEVVTKT